MAHEYREVELVSGQSQKCQDHPQCQRIP